MNSIEKCNICGEGCIDKFKLKFNDIVGMADRYEQRIGVCSACGFIFTKNPFDDEQLSNRYKNHSKFEFDAEDYILSESEDYKIRSLRQKQFIERVIGLDKVDSILEVGAASGYNLGLYKECKVYGIEPSSVNCKNAKKYYDVDMFCGMFDEFWEKNKGEKYSLIFLSHVLEHLVNPKDFVEKCSKINDAYFFIEVPTLDYKFVDEPYGMFCEEHVNIFTLESLEKLMGACGYELMNADIIIGVEQSLPAGWPAVSTIWKKSNKIKYHQMAAKSEFLLENYINQSDALMLHIKDTVDRIDNNKKLAIWGTGHHASMLLANTSLLEKNIVKVYDSDKRKEGVSFGGAVITPFDAEDIKNGTVETILVATYTAQKALVKILEPYKDKVEVVTLYDL